MRGYGEFEGVSLSPRPVFAANVRWFDGVPMAHRCQLGMESALDALKTKKRASVPRRMDLEKPSLRRGELKRTWETNADVCCVSYFSGEGRAIYSRTL